MSRKPPSPTDLCAKIAEASRVSGLAESTVCNRLFGNSHLPNAARVRAKRTAEQIAKLDIFIAQHLRGEA